MKWISYDVDSHYLGQGYMPITSTSQTEYERLFQQTVAQQDGFIQFFVANETPQAVYFDDISGMVRRIQQAPHQPTSSLQE